MIFAPSRDDVAMHRFENCVVIETEDAGRRKLLQALPMMGAVVEGVFKIGHPKSEGVEISEQIQYTMDLLGVDEFAVDSPYAPVFKALLRMLDFPQKETPKEADLMEMKLVVQACLEDARLEKKQSPSIKKFLDGFSLARVHLIGNSVAATGGRG